MNHLKSQVLMDIMKAMQQRDGNRLRPKPPEPAPMPEMPHMATGGEVPEMGEGSDMSEEDAKILEQLFDQPEEGIEGQSRVAPNEAHEEEDDDDESDGPAGRGA